jgi:nucleoid-associated protein YgaU
MRKFIVAFAAVVALAGGALLGLYVLGQGPFAPSTSEQGPVADLSGGSAPAQLEPAATPSPEPAAKPQADATGALTPPAEPTSVPTFDVVVIEPNGEGVVAGRAAPGWQVSVQSGGTKVGEAKADLQGEWSVVLEKPLPAGDHALSLKITSPDGTRALSSQESVRVAVGADAKKASAPAGVEGAATAAAPTPDAVAPAPTPQAAAPTPVPTPPTAADAAPPSGNAQVARADETPAAAEGPRATARSEEAAPAPRPTLIFKTADYVDTGAGTGTVTLSGIADPGAKISIFSDNALIAEAKADRDGSWRVVVQKKLGMGQHNFRAEQGGSGAGTLARTAMVTIERVEPKPEPPKAQPVAAAPPTVAAAEKKESAGTYIIRQGDTLWAIAKRYLGSGLRYTSIFQDNRKVIRNPNLIHPKQELNVPAD